MIKDYLSIIKGLRKTFCSSNISSKYMICMILSFSIIIIPLANTDTGWYYPLLAVMSIAPIFILGNFYIMKRESYFILLLPFVFLSFITNENSFRFSTVLFTSMYIITYIAYNHLCYKAKLTLNVFNRVLEFILYSYAFVLLIQQILALLKLPVINLNSGNSSIFKLNSLAFESSNTVLIVTIIFFSYLKLSELFEKKKTILSKSFRENKRMWLLYLYVMFTCGSMSAFFVLPIFLCYFLQKRDLKFVFFSVLFILISCFIVDKYEIFDFSRFTNLIPVLLELNIEQIILVDPSAACRIAPTLTFFSSIDLAQYSTWFGHGIDASQTYVTELIIGADDERTSVGAINIFSFFYDYGLLAGIIFLIALSKAISKHLFSYEMLLYITSFSILSINHYILWLFIILLSTNKYFKDKYSKTKITKELL